MPNRFPNQWSTQSKVWTPQATRIEVSGPLASEAGELVLAVLCRPKASPQMLASMKRFTKRLEQLSKAEQAAKAAKPALKKR